MTGDPMTSVQAAERKTLELDQGPIAYADRGEGEPIVFVHGLLVDGRLWQATADRLVADGCRCIVPDWPLGSHRAAMKPEADLAPPGIANLIADFLAALDLDRVTIVGNDTGGAISQILVASRPQRIARLVLTNCDAFENFPPFPFGAMGPIAKLPGGMTALALPFRLGPIRRAVYGQFADRPPDRLTESWLAPSFGSAEIRRDVRKFLLGIDKRQTLAAAERFGALEIPVLIAWAPGDRYFPLRYADRLAAAIPNARLETIAGAKTFVPLDQPERLAELIAGFAGG